MHYVLKGEEDEVKVHEVGRCFILSDINGCFCIIVKKESVSLFDTLSLVYVEYFFVFSIAILLFSFVKWLMFGKN